MKKSQILRKAIMARRAVAVPGCHDALSAKVIEKAGFEAIQISGYGLAGSYLAKPDVGLLRMKDVLDMSWNITQAVTIPVMADIDTGGGNAVNAAWVTERLIAMGLAGMNIEDQVFPKRCGHMAGKEVISAEEMAGKIRACSAVRREARQGLHHQRPDGRFRRDGPGRSHQSAATSTSRPGPTWPSSTASRAGPTSRRRSSRSRDRSPSTLWTPSPA